MELNVYVQIWTGELNINEFRNILGCMGARNAAHW